MAFFVLITTVALVTFLQRVTDENAELPGFSFSSARGAAAAADRLPQAPAATPRTGGTALPPVSPDFKIAWWVPVAIALVLFGLVVLIDVATPNKKISSISAVLFGLLAGILATVAISAIIELALRVWLPDAALRTIEPLIQIIKPLLGIALCYLGITTILQTQDDFRLVIPYVEFAKQIRGTKPLMLDTSALIDARIADVAATGLLQAPLIIPRFVVAELQTLSDSADRLKRARGRRGLEVVTRLQRQGTLDVSIDETPVAAMAVDQALVRLADQLTARIITTDHGLTRVAQIHGVSVLNMHDIAAAFRPQLIPGEVVSLRLVKPGEHAGQGVGYLDDGTMVVAEHAADMIGREVQVLVTSTIQTAAGRMVFARLSGDGSREPELSQAPPAVPAQASVEARDDQPVGDLPDRAALAETPGDDHAPSPEAEEPSGERDTTAAFPPRGPFPPRAPARRPPSPRNPRR